LIYWSFLLLSYPVFPYVFFFLIIKILKISEWWM